jgi:hypothetical protein
MFLFYSISAILCFAAFCAAHYMDVNNGIDLDISDIFFTIAVSAIPFINTVGIFYALYHVGSFGWMNKTLIKGKKQ